MRKQKLSKKEKAFLGRVGDRVGEIIAIRDWTYDEVATAAGVARSTLREVIAGKTNVRLGNLQRIVCALGFGSLTVFLESVE